MHTKENKIDLKGGEKSKASKVFVAFESIDHVTGCYQTKYMGATHVITEKVHGSNFSFITDGTEIKAAKHSSTLGPNADFHNYQTVLEKYRSNICQLHALVTKIYEVGWVTIYGELFGGAYPFYKGEGDPNNLQSYSIQSVGIKKPVQKGIFYCPRVDFYAFDIYLPEKATFLPFEKALELFQTCKFIHAEPLFMGSVKEVDEWPLQGFKSTIYKKFNLPEYPDNIAEGIVIRSITGDRHILKKVTKKFREKVGNENPEKYDNPTLFNGDFKALIASAQTDITNYVTVNRLVHVLSKKGPVKGDEKQLVKIQGFLIQDVIHDFSKDYEKLWDLLEKGDKNILNNAVKQKAQGMIETHKAKILADDLSIEDDPINVICHTQADK